MSFLRSGYPYIYVDGISKEYIFETGNKKKSWIEDYGGMSNESIVELLLHFGEENNSLIMKYMGKRLAENLKIKLRKKPLTFEQSMKLWSKIFNKTGLKNDK